NPSAQNPATALKVDTFLLSCRVLGRGVEHRTLAYLGELAQQQGLEWLDVPFHQSAKNKPAGDFLESVGRNFCQPQNGGFLFRFPTTFAANVRFASEATKMPGSEVPASPVLNNGEQPRQKFTLCRKIALEFADTARIQRAIEAQVETTAVARQTEYVAPRTDLERQVCELWERLLRRT